MTNPQPRILCADDHEDTCFMLSALLGNSGYEVKHAGGVGEALNLARAEHFDCSSSTAATRTGRASDCAGSSGRRGRKRRSSSTQARPSQKTGRWVSGPARRLTSSSLNWIVC